jgi:hypothetical protein
VCSPRHESETIGEGHGPRSARPRGGREEGARMSVDDSVAIVLAAFEAVERCDQQRLREPCHPQAEFHWPALLPFGGSSRGGVRDQPGPSCPEAWQPLQPTAAERRMDPRVVAATGREVVVLWRQRAVGQAASAWRPRCLACMRSGAGASRADVLLRHRGGPPVPRPGPARVSGPRRRRAMDLTDIWLGRPGVAPPGRLARVVIARASCVPEATTNGRCRRPLGGGPSWSLTHLPQTSRHGGWLVLTG